MTGRAAEVCAGGGQTGGGGRRQEAPAGRIDLRSILGAWSQGRGSGRREGTEPRADPRPHLPGLSLAADVAGVGLGGTGSNGSLNQAGWAQLDTLLPRPPAALGCPVGTPEPGLSLLHQRPGPWPAGPWLLCRYLGTREGMVWGALLSPPPPGPGELQGQTWLDCRRRDGVSQSSTWTPMWIGVEGVVWGDCAADEPPSGPLQDDFFSWLRGCFPDSCPRQVVQPDL